MKGFENSAQKFYKGFRVKYHIKMLLLLRKLIDNNFFNRKNNLFNEFNGRRKERVFRGRKMRNERNNKEESKEEGCKEGSSLLLRLATR